MTILIIFETVEGQTRKISHFVENESRKSGQDVVLVDTAKKTTSLSFVGVDKVILAAPVHERRHPKKFEIFIAENLHELVSRETMLISVSLKAAFPECLEEAQDFLVEMEMRTGLTPDVEALVAGAVRPSSYDYFATHIMRHVVLRGRDYVLDEGEHEFTDWKALATKLSKFLAAGTSSG